MPFTSSPRSLQSGGAFCGPQPPRTNLGDSATEASSPVRVRYFGWLHPSAKRRRMLVENLLEKVTVVHEKAAPPRWHLRCPHCEQFTLVVVGKLLPIRAPP